MPSALILSPCPPPCSPFLVVRTSTWVGPPGRHGDFLLFPIYLRLSVCLCTYLSQSLSIPKRELKSPITFFSLNSEYIGEFKRHGNREELGKTNPDHHKDSGNQLGSPFVLQVRRQRPKERRKSELLKCIMSQTELLTFPHKPASHLSPWRRHAATCSSQTPRVIPEPSLSITQHRHPTGQPFGPCFL